LINFLASEIKTKIIKKIMKSHLELIIFLYIVDKTIVTLQNRFEQFKIYEDIFGFLFSIKNLKLLGCVLLKEKCLNIEKYLKHDNLLDLNGLDLFSELNS